MTRRFRRRGGPRFGGVPGLPAFGLRGNPEPNAGQSGRPLSTLFGCFSFFWLSMRLPSTPEALKSSASFPTAPHWGALLKQNAALYRDQGTFYCLLPPPATRVIIDRTYRVCEWAVIMAERVKLARFAVLGHFFNRDLGHFRHRHQLQGTLLAILQLLLQSGGWERGWTRQTGTFQGTGARPKWVGCEHPPPEKQVLVRIRACRPHQTKSDES